MSFLDTYRHNVQRKSEEISRLMQEKAREQKKLADLSGRINNSFQSMNRTKSPSVIQSRLHDIQRYQNEVAKVEKMAADLEAKIATKQKELGDEQKKVTREEEKELIKRNLDAKKQAQEHQKRMTQIQSTLVKHDRLHVETLSALERLQQLPERIVVLFLASNPLDLPQLRLDEEARAIADMIRKSRHRDSVKLESCWAVRPMDILQALNEHLPAIVHFSGHGSDQDEIVFQDVQGNARVVTKDAIVQTMMASSEGIRLVFFNTCYSRNQAEAVVQHVEAAIGMNTSIGDEAARVFASQFYSSIGFGHSVKKAFDQAKALLMMEGIPEEDIPELFVHAGLDPETFIIVRPSIENCHE